MDVGCLTVLWSSPWDADHLPCRFHLRFAEKQQRQGHAEHSMTSPQGKGRAEADPILHPKPKPLAWGPPGAGCSPRSLPCPTRHGDSGGSGSGDAQPASGTAAARSPESLKCRQRGLHDKAGGGRPCKLALHATYGSFGGGDACSLFDGGAVYLQSG